MSSWKLTIKEPITTAADNKFFDIFSNLLKKIMYDISSESADVSHEISCLLCYF